MSQPILQKNVFVTVGTTNFDNLIRKMVQSKTLQILKKRGYSSIKLQIGNGQFEPSDGSFQGMEIESYRYKPSLKDDVQNADLIISHAGAGTCLEVLHLRKPLVVVVNHQLMDNHQTELAEALHSRGYVVSTNLNDLERTIEDFDPAKLTSYELPNPSLFGNFLNQVMEISQ